MKSLKITFIFTMIMLCFFGFEKETIVVLAEEVHFEKEQVMIVTTNEIDYLNALLSATDSELLEKGFTTHEIEEIRNYDYNADLIRLSLTEKNKLKKMGYSEEQIKLIKSYNGQENAVNYVSTYGLSNAELQGNHWMTPIEDRNTIKIEYMFRWNHAPIFCIVDSVALAWVGCDINSNALVLNVESEEHTVYYHDELTDELLFTREPDIALRASGRIMNFSMKSSQEAAEYYAKKIEGQVIIQTLANSYNLERVSVCAAYGHTYIGLGPASITISVTGITPSIELALNQEDLYVVCKNILAYDE